MAAPHPTLKQTYAERAEHPDVHPIAHYLLHLISTKKSNLCLSADVSTTAELLRLAEEVGDSICILKTHADIIDDFSDRSYKRLAQVANRRKFLIFEDRKLADVGSTVQKQYTSGPLKIAQWAQIVNAHVLPGAPIVKALKQAADWTLSSFNSSVKTDITASPLTSPLLSDSSSADELRQLGHGYTRERLGSVHSIETTTTIETFTEPRSPFSMRRDSSNRVARQSDMARELQELGNPPVDRALLLLAQMSSAENLLTGSYTQKCVEIARDNTDFVVGFIAQQSLNTEANDRFITMTPGVSLPPKGESAALKGDGLGQQYNTPRKVVLEMGSDVIIVGRGIIKADDPRAEAERYRAEAWKAYEERLSS